MKKNKFLIITILVFIMTTLTGCNKVTTHNYSLIKIEMTKSEVIEILGLPNETYDNLTSTDCLWLSNGNTYEEAVNLSKKGKRIKYIIVTFTGDLVNGEPYVLSKDFGNLEDIGMGA